MFSFIRRLLNGTLAPTTESLVIPPQPASRGSGLDVFQGEEDPGDYAITRYPPFDQGIPVISVEKIVQSQMELLERIFRTAGVSRADFDKLYMTAVWNLAKHVHLLPATSTTYFRGTGGLFRMALEVALNALQSANAAVFPVGGGVERRYGMQPKWTLASFLAGLCSQNYRTVNSMAVLTRDSQQWAPLLDPLYQWCEQVHADVYFVRWMEDVHVHGAQASAAYSISLVVPHEVLQYLASDNNQIVPSMTAAIAGVETSMSENPIGRLVAPVITRVIEDDLKRSATNYGHLVIGAHLEMHLVDAMRRLVRGGKWIANNVASGGRLWVGKEGVFIDWQLAAGDIANLLVRDSFAGIPKDPDTLADLLVSANLLQNNGRGARYWTIALPETLEVKEGMVKLRQGEVIFPQGFSFEPYQNVQLTLGAEAEVSGQPQGDGKVRMPTTKKRPAWQPTYDASTSRQFADDEPPPIDELPPYVEANVPPPTGTSEPPSPNSLRPERKNDKPQSETGQASLDLVEGKSIPVPSEQQSGAGDTSSIASKLLDSIDRTHAWLLNEVLQAYRAGTLKDEVAALPYGFGISHDELARHGMPVNELVTELGLKGWLWNDKTRATRKIHAVEIAGKTHRMMILKPDIAAGLGFDIAPRD